MPPSTQMSFCMKPRSSRSPAVDSRIMSRPRELPSPEWHFRHAPSFLSGRNLVYISLSESKYPLGYSDLDAWLKGSLSPGLSPGSPSTPDPPRPKVAGSPVSFIIPRPSMPISSPYSRMAL